MDGAKVGTAAPGAKPGRPWWWKKSGDPMDQRPLTSTRASEGKVVRKAGGADQYQKRRLRGA